MTLALRLARREMRSGLGGFRLFIACLALGVGDIAAILSFSRAIEEGLRADAREILGGDVSVSVLYREATPEQTAFYIDLMRKVQATPEWKDYIEKSSQTQVFLAGPDLTKYMNEDSERVRKVAAEQGWLVGN